MAAYYVCPTIHGCIASVFWWVSFSFLVVFGFVISASAFVSVMYMVIKLCFECVDGVGEGLDLHIGRLLGSICLCLLE